MTPSGWRSPVRDPVARINSPTPTASRPQPARVLAFGSGRLRSGPWGVRRTRTRAAHQPHRNQSDSQTQCRLHREGLVEHRRSPDRRHRGHQEHQGVDLGDSGALEDEPVEAVAAERGEGDQPGRGEPEGGRHRWGRGPGHEGHRREDQRARRAVDRHRDGRGHLGAGAAVQEGRCDQREHPCERDHVRPPGHATRRGRVRRRDQGDSPRPRHRPSHWRGRRTPSAAGLPVLPRPAAGCRRSGPSYRWRRPAGWRSRR